MGAHSRCGVSVPVPTTPLPIQLRADAQGKAAGDVLSMWASATLVGDPGGVPGSWLCPSSPSGCLDMWQVNQ